MTTENIEGNVSGPFQSPRKEAAASLLSLHQEETTEQGGQNEDDIKMESADMKEKTTLRRSPRKRHQKAEKILRRSPRKKQQKSDKIEEVQISRRSTRKTRNKEKPSISTNKQSTSRNTVRTYNKITKKRKNISTLSSESMKPKLRRSVRRRKKPSTFRESQGYDVNAWNKKESKRLEEMERKKESQPPLRRSKRKRKKPKTFRESQGYDVKAWNRAENERLDEIEVEQDLSDFHEANKEADMSICDYTIRAGDIIQYKDHMMAEIQTQLVEKVRYKGRNQMNYSVNTFYTPDNFDTSNIKLMKRWENGKYVEVKSQWRQQCAWKYVNSELDPSLAEQIRKKEEEQYEDRQRAREKKLFISALKRNVIADAFVRPERLADLIKECQQEGILDENENYTGEIKEDSHDDSSSEDSQFGKKYLNKRKRHEDLLKDLSLPSDCEDVQPPRRRIKRKVSAYDRLSKDIKKLDKEISMSKSGRHTRKKTKSIDTRKKTKNIETEVEYQKTVSKCQNVNRKFATDLYVVQYAFFLTESWHGVRKDEVRDTIVLQKTYDDTTAQNFIGAGQIKRRMVKKSVGGYNLNVNECNTLRPGAYVSDAIINSYLEVIMADKNIEEGCEMMPSQFAQKIASEVGEEHHIYEDMIPDLVTWASAALKRYNARKPENNCPSILNLKYLFIPVCENSHWFLVVVKFSTKDVVVLDSLGSSLEDHKDSLATRWTRLIIHFLSLIRRQDIGWPLVGEWQSHQWERKVILNCPKQKNGYDCGMFLLAVAELVALGRRVNVCGDSIVEHMRKRVACTLAKDRPELDGGLSPPTEK